MDPLSALLSGIRAEGSVVAHAELAGPWTIRFADRAPLVMVTVLRGGGTLLLPDGGRRPIGAGETAVVQGARPFLLADTPDTPAGPHEQYEIACVVGEGCSDGQPLGGERPDAEASTALVVGAYRASGQRHKRLLQALPDVLVVSGETDLCPWLEAAAVEITANGAGAQALMDRLVDWGLVCTLREWLAGQGDRAPGWYRGLSDPVVGPALDAVHSAPFARWTVADLAARARVSRALFARRFTEVMGQPPLAYLTEWRMVEAEELLQDPGRTVGQVAQAVGYADAFGFSSAYKRLRGITPTEFRSRAAYAAASSVAN